MLGDAAQQCPAKVEKHIFLLIQSILAAVDEDQCEALSLLPFILHLQITPFTRKAHFHS